jgi:8-oxo-dGTP pyrophosphatase MutT (NUDIX family)
MRVEIPQTQFSKIICGIVLLRSDGAALLQHRDDKPGLQAAGQWVFPGGHAEAGENFQSCALREFEEETTYRCNDPQWLVTLPDCYDPSWEPYQLVIFWDIYDGRRSYECREGQGVEFVPRADADYILMAEYQRHIWDLALLRKALFDRRP